jgi:hypothetical protein
MSSHNSWKNNNSLISETDEDKQTILMTLVYEENGRANEIYALAERLHTALKPDCPENTDSPALMESLKELNSSIGTALAAVVNKEIVINGKIEKVLEQSRHFDYGDR